MILNHLPQKVAFYNRDSKFLRNRNMRICAKNTHDGQFVEISMEFTSDIRKRLQKNY